MSADLDGPARGDLYGAAEHEYPKVCEVSLDQLDLRDPTFQFRLTASVSSLLGSMESVGQEEPVHVRGTSPYQVVDGFRRIECARRLGWKTVLAFVHSELSDRGAYLLAFTNNIERKNLSPLERANAMFLAQKRGFRKAELAELFRISERQVERDLGLIRDAPHILKIVDGKVVTLSHARVLAQFGVKNAGKWRRRIMDDGLSAAALRRVLTKENGSSPAGRKRRFVKKEKGGVRVYGFRVTRTATEEERQRAIRALEDAIRYLKRDAWSPT